MSNEQIINELKAKHLVLSKNICKGPETKPHPQKIMKFVARKGLDDYGWRCNFCGNRKSLRAGSLFEGLRLPIVFLFKLILHWVLQSKYQNLQTMFNCSRQFIYEFFHRLRYLSLKDYDRENVKLGGPGKIVEIDESLFMKVKHHRGKDLLRRQVWVFGLRERHTGRCFFEIVSSRNREKLLPIIYRHCLPESVIFSDKWKAYNDIGELDAQFKHYSVNHSLHFVEPKPIEINTENHKLHTNGIESDWNACKNRFRMMRGCSRAHLQAYIDEFCWRRNIERTSSANQVSQEELRNKRMKLVFDAIISAIVCHFSQNGSRIETTDKYANIFNYDENDESWMHHIAKGSDEYEDEDEDGDEIDCDYENEISLLKS